MQTIDNDFDEEITFNLKKYLYILWNRKILIFFVFLAVIAFSVIITFFSPKKYTVEADLYINKSNYTNLAEFNPFVIESQTEDGFSISSANKLANEIELIKSALVIDNVIKENNLIYQKKFGFITTSKTGKYYSTKAFLGKGKNPKFDNVKNTNILKIKYTSKNPEKAYNIVNSIINNYIDLQRTLNAEKSKSDKSIIEREYNKVKSQLNQKINQSSGLPESAVGSMGNMTAMSAFSTSVSRAMANLQGQILTGKRSQIAVSEDAAKTAELSSKLEWARIVEEMSDNSKVLIINPPVKPEKYEISSPNLFKNILWGIIWGLLLSLSALIFVETTSKKLTYSMLGDDIIYDLEKNLTDFQIYMLSTQGEKVAFVTFDNLNISKYDFEKIQVLEAEISDKFINSVKKYDKFILFSSIGETDSSLYKQTKLILSSLNKVIIKDVLINISKKDGK